MSTTVNPAAAEAAADIVQSKPVSRGALVRRRFMRNRWALGGIVMIILLYVVEGKNDLATQLIFGLEKAAPTPPSYIAISETLKTVGDKNGSRFWAARGLQHFPRDTKLQSLLRG